MCLYNFILVLGNLPYLLIMQLGPSILQSRRSATNLNPFHVKSQTANNKFLVQRFTCHLSHIFRDQGKDRNQLCGGMSPLQYMEVSEFLVWPSIRWGRKQHDN